MVRWLPGGAGFETVIATGDPLTLASGAFGLDSTFASVWFPRTTLRPEGFGFVSVSAQGDIALLCRALVNGSLSRSEVHVTSAGALDVAYFVPEALPGFPDIFGVNGGSARGITDDGALLTRIIFNNASDGALRLDDSGVSIPLRTGDALPSGAIAPDGGNLVLAWGLGGEGAGGAGGELVAFDRFGAQTALTPADGSAPGVAEGEFDFFDDVSIARDGSVIADGTMRRSRDVRQNENEGVWATRAGALELLARENDPAPGLAGLAFAEIGANAIVDGLPVVHAGGADALVFEPRLRDTGGASLPTDADDSLWLADARGLGGVLREGGPASGVDGATFAWSTRRAVSVNARADMVLLWSLSPGAGGVEEGVNDFGLWVRDGSAGGLSLVVRTGDAVDVSREGETPDVRTVSSIRFDPDTGLAENGRFGYALDFDDGSAAAFVGMIDAEIMICAADFDGDGDVDFGDFGLFVTQFDRDDCPE